MAPTRGRKKKANVSDEDNVRRRGGSSVRKEDYAQQPPPSSTRSMMTRRSQTRAATETSSSAKNEKNDNKHKTAQTTSPTPRKRARKEDITTTTTATVSTDVAKAEKSSSPQKEVVIMIDQQSSPKWQQLMHEIRLTEKVNDTQADAQSQLPPPLPQQQNGHHHEQQQQQQQQSVDDAHKTTNEEQDAVKETVSITRSEQHVDDENDQERVTEQHLVQLEPAAPIDTQVQPSQPQFTTTIKLIDPPPTEVFTEASLIAEAINHQRLMNHRNNITNVANNNHSVTTTMLTSPLAHDDTSSESSDSEGAETDDYNYDSGSGGKKTRSNGNNHYRATSGSANGVLNKSKIDTDFIAKLIPNKDPNDRRYDLNEINKLRLLSHSYQNFSVKLLTRLFDEEEIIGRNVYGRNYSGDKSATKQPLDPERINFIKQTVLRLTKTNNPELAWASCVIAMNRKMVDINNKYNKQLKEATTTSQVVGREH